MATWQEILESQLSDKPPRLSVEEATILYDEADQNELLHEDDDMMAFKHVVTQKNGKKFRITQIQLYKEGTLCTLKRLH